MGLPGHASPQSRGLKKALTLLLVDTEAKAVPAKFASLAFKR